MAKSWKDLSDYDRDFVTDADLDDGFEESDASKAERRSSGNQNRRQGQAAANVQADGATVNLNIHMPNINIGKFDFSAAPKSQEKEAEKQAETVKETDSKGVGTKESIESLMVEGKNGQMMLKEASNYYEREAAADVIAHERSQKPISEREARERIDAGEFSTDVEPFMSDEEKSDALLREQEEREDRLYEEWLANKNGGNTPPTSPSGGSSAVKDVLNKAGNIPDVSDRQNETKLP